MSDARLEELLDVLVAFAKRDFARRATVDGDDVVAGIATGLNMLAEELDGETASRAELEAAYRELKETQSKLIQVEKMASIGLLASGVAHEVNNPAAWVSLSLELLKRAVSTLERDAVLDPVRAEPMLTQMRALLDDAVDGMTRIITVVQDLRNLSRADEPAIDEVSFREIVAGARRLAGSVLEKTDVVVRVDDTVTIVANRGRVAQIVTNLLVNGAHAVRSVPSPRIVIATKIERGGVILSVEDNGPGIPAELREAVFQPFFTTKGPAEGTGLGLTIVLQLASNGGGWARAVDAIEEGGARIEVFLPDRPPHPSLPIVQ